jgi:hypothetical protein
MNGMLIVADPISLIILVIVLILLLPALPCSGLA